MELTVLWEENLSYAHERKLSRYDNLVAQCQARGWNWQLFAVEIGCGSFSANCTQIPKQVRAFRTRT